MRALSSPVPTPMSAAVLEAAESDRGSALVLGSGLAGLADAAEDAVAIPYGELEGFPHVGSVAGHAGRLVVGKLGGVPVMLFQGRAHQYQGVSALDAAYPARLAAAVACEVLVTMRRRSCRGSCCRRPHLDLGPHNLMGTHPLIGWPGPPEGVACRSSRCAMPYEPRARTSARRSALEQGSRCATRVRGAPRALIRDAADVASCAAWPDAVGYRTVPRRSSPGGGEALGSSAVTGDQRRGGLRALAPRGSRGRCGCCSAAPTAHDRIRLAGVIQGAQRHGSCYTFSVRLTPGRAFSSTCISRRHRATSREGPITRRSWQGAHRVGR